MTTKALIDHAVINTSNAGLSGLADRLFSHWFNRLVYAQIWEDPVVDIAALNLQPGARIATISSGGCNALAYLATQPACVHVVDLNEAHLAMLELKKTALAHLPDYPHVLNFLGAADRAENNDLYRAAMAPHLSEASREYWETKDWRGRPRYTCFSRHAYRHGLLGQFIGMAHWLVRRLGGDLSKMIGARSLAEQAERFDRYIAPAFDHPLVKWLSQRPMILYSLGIPPAQFAELQADAKAQGVSLAELFKARMRHLACSFPLDENCFAQQAFGRRYPIERDSALPMYLQAAHYETIRTHLHAIHAHHQTMTALLADLPAQSLDAYLFLDAQDWMDDAQITALWEQVTRTAAPGARVVFRTGGSQSPLERKLPAEILGQWLTDPVTNQAWHQQDRSAIYGGTHLYVRR